MKTLVPGGTPRVTNAIVSHALKRCPCGKYVIINVLLFYDYMQDTADTCMFRPMFCSAFTGRGPNANIGEGDVALFRTPNAIYSSSANQLINPDGFPLCIKYVTGPHNVYEKYKHTNAYKHIQTQ